MSEDPLGFAGGENSYAYANGNPLSFIDPMGLFGWRDGVSIGVGMIPFVGTAQSVVELASGQDYITGEPANRWLAAAGLLVGVVPGGKSLLKGSAKVFEKSAVKGAGNGFDMALGLARHGETGSPLLLKKFADKVGAKTYGDIYGSWWPGTMEKLETEITAAMNKADNLHFNLDQISPSNFKAFIESPTFRNGNITNWELNTIMNNPDLLKKTIFYSPGGGIVPTPTW